MTTVALLLLMCIGMFVAYVVGLGLIVIAFQVLPGRGAGSFLFCAALIGIAEGVLISWMLVPVAGGLIPIVVAFVVGASLTSDAAERLGKLTGSRSGT